VNHFILPILILRSLYQSLQPLIEFDREFKLEYLVLVIEKDIIQNNIPTHTLIEFP